MRKDVKMIIVTAPSGAGKTTIVRHLLEKFDELAFSVSATSRPKRPHEGEGVDYYFYSPEAFMKLVEEDAFVEWEEVYENQYYGTLKREVERISDLGKKVLFDIDVKGAMTMKRKFPRHSYAIFIQPPNLEILLERLKNRKTETEESLNKRIKKATIEMTFSEQFDTILINDDLDLVLLEARDLIKRLL